MVFSCCILGFSCLKNVGNNKIVDNEFYLTMTVKTLWSCVIYLFVVSLMMMMPGIQTIYSTRSGIFYCDLFHCGKASNFGLLQIWDVKYIISSLTFESQLKTLFFFCAGPVCCEKLLNKRWSYYTFYYTFYMMTAIIRLQARWSMVQIPAGAREFSLFLNIPTGFGAAPSPLFNAFCCSC